MNDQQLPLFNRRTIIMGEGYRQLAAFKFKEAMQHFEDAHHARLETDKEVAGALQACEYWQPMMQHSGESIDNIYEKFRRYDFGQVPGLQQFKHALLKHITNEMLATDRFYLNDNKIVPDLLLELQHDKKAEEVVTQNMEKHPDDSQLTYFLAQTQWKNNKQGEAKKNLARALLGNPCNIPYERIEYKGLITLIEKVGAEMAPAFGWVRNILPLISLPQEIKICSEAHRRAIKSYRYLYLADKAAVNNNRTRRLDYRKKLNEQAPDLYEEYFALFTNG